MPEPEHTAPLSAALLDVRRLRIHFGSSVAVDDITLTVRASETLGLVGESGSGKSATSLAILRLLDPAARVSGEILFRGTDLLREPETAMRKRRGSDIAMVFQEPMTALNPVMTVGEQIAEAIRAHNRGISRTEVRERVCQVLDEVALPKPTKRMNDYPHQFSGGQRQRIVIAMAIVNRPRLLIADEPTTALDVTVQAQILRLLQTLREHHGLAMLFISHDLAVTAQVADRIAVMQHGRIVEEQPTSQLFHAPRNLYTQQLLAAAPTMFTDRSKPLAYLPATA